MNAQELIAKVLELDANSTQEFDIDLGRIDILVDEFERTGKFKNHAKAVFMTMSRNGLPVCSPSSKPS